MADPIVVARDESVRGLRSAIRWLGTAVVVLAVGLGISLYQNRLSVERDNEQGLRFVHSACIQENVVTLQVREAFVKSILVFVNGPNLTPERVRLLELFEQEVAKQIPFRDCSDAGIREYIEHPPEDPATKENP